MGEAALHEQIANLQGLVNRLEIKVGSTTAVEEENQRLNETLIEVEKELNRFRNEAKQAKNEIPNGNEDLDEIIRLNLEKNVALEKDINVKNDKLQRVTAMYREKLEEIVSISKEKTSLAEQFEILQKNADIKDEKLKQLKNLSVMNEQVVELEKAMAVKSSLVHQLERNLASTQQSNEELFQQLESRDTKMNEM